MSDTLILPDVNLLLAFGWRTHANHQQTRQWFANLKSFATCAITELGFLRVSMSPAYRAGHDDAVRVLQNLTTRNTASFLNCDLPATSLTPVSSYKDTKDCYLAELARRHSCKLATLDEGLLRAPWANGVAFHPFRQ